MKILLVVSLFFNLLQNVILLDIIDNINALIDDANNIDNILSDEIFSEDDL